MSHFAFPLETWRAWRPPPGELLRGKREPQEWPIKQCDWFLQTPSVFSFKFNFAPILLFSSRLLFFLICSYLTCCLAMATTAVSYILTLEMPIPQNMAKASTKFSSLLKWHNNLETVLTVSSNKLLNDTNTRNASRDVACNPGLCSRRRRRRGLQAQVLEDGNYLAYLVKGMLSNLLMSWKTPSTLPGLPMYLIGIARTVRCLNSEVLSTLGSNLGHIFIATFRR